MSSYRTYLKTLRRVPDDIVLSVASRDVEPVYSDRCLCGWFVREQIERMTRKRADDVDLPYDAPVPGCVDAFGGTYQEWTRLFTGIYIGPTAGSIERAFVERVLECVR